MEEVTQEGKRLIEAYKRTQGRVVSAESALTTAQEDARNAEHELATWLMPSDMKNGETIGVWMGDSIFAVTLAYEPRVTVRARGKYY